MHKSTLGYKNIININKPMDYACLEENISELPEKFKFIEKSAIGESYLGKNINLLKIGDGPHKVIYIGSHHGSEWITSLILKINLHRPKPRILPILIVMQDVKFFYTVMCLFC